MVQLYIAVYGVMASRAGGAPFHAGLSGGAGID
jgi:hypothetical protein